MAIFRVSGKAIMAGITSLVASMNGITSWQDYTSTQKFIVFATAAGAMWLVIDSFLDQTISRLQKNPRLLEEVPEDTTFLVKPAETVVESKP